MNKGDESNKKTKSKKRMTKFKMSERNNKLKQ